MLGRCPLLQLNIRSVAQSIVMGAWPCVRNVLTYTMKATPSTITLGVLLRPNCTVHAITRHCSSVEAQLQVPPGTLQYMKTSLAITPSPMRTRTRIESVVALVWFNITSHHAAKFLVCCVLDARHGGHGPLLMYVTRGKRPCHPGLDHSTATSIFGCKALTPLVMLIALIALPDDDEATHCTPN